jgi:error-prone DNA polymerase
VLAQDLCKVANKGLLSISGVVTGRQAPGTAGGVTFLTLEDETGNMNVIVWQSTARAQKNQLFACKSIACNGYS